MSDACDICHKATTLEYVDCRLGPMSPAPGRWANCCWECFQRLGVGLGIGRGQHYRRGSSEDGWSKVPGL